MEKNPVLYILARSDMQSLNPGKLAAQACHAANAFVARIDKLEKAKAPKHLINLYKTWEKSTVQNFGTTIVLDAGNVESMTRMVESLNCNPAYVTAGIIWDPTYPVKDGSTMHYLNIPTCAYVFLDTKDTENCATEIAMLKELQLYA